MSSIIFTNSTVTSRHISVTNEYRGSGGMDAESDELFRRSCYSRDLNLSPDECSCEDTHVRHLRSQARTVSVRHQRI